MLHVCNDDAARQMHWLNNCVRGMHDTLTRVMCQLAELRPKALSLSFFCVQEIKAGLVVAWEEARAVCKVMGQIELEELNIALQVGSW